MAYKFPLERLPGVKTPALEEGAQYLDSYLYSVLTTEDSHALTVQMAERAQNEETLTDIIAACTQVDIEALERLSKTYLNSKKFNELVDAIKQTIANDGHIYIAGCGSSGRLALFIERICREILPKEYQNKITAVMAGGDFALVRAIEDFEDKGKYGIKQLSEQKFNPSKDLYLGVSASGSAKFNNQSISDQAEKIKNNDAPTYLKPWLICCNDADKLESIVKEQTELARKTNPNAESTHPLIDYGPYMQCLGLDVGPNALAGSSRMQSATVSEIALYYALLEASGKFSKDQVHSQLSLLIKKLKEADFSNQLKPLILAEAKCYEEGGHVIYKTKSENAITVFTDLTERNPTFKLPKIENSLIHETEYAWCSLNIDDVSKKEDSFRAMLERDPFSLNWENEPRTSSKMIEGFDFSDGAKERREGLTGKKHLIMDIGFSKDRKELTVTFIAKDQTHKAKFNLDGLDEFSRQMFLKMLLNTHSTLVMGRMKKYAGNLMTNLNVSNAKLFARVVRLTMQSIIGTLNMLGLNLFASLMKTPGIPVNHATQAVAMVVADSLINDKAKKPNLTTVALAMQTFLQKADITTENLDHTRKQQTAAKQLVVFDDAIEEQKYGSVRGHKQRRNVLTAFFQSRHQLSNQVIDSVVPKVNKIKI